MRTLLAPLIALFLPLSWHSASLAQGCGPTNPNCVVPDRPSGDSTNAAANTRFVTNANGVFNVMDFGAKCDNSTDDAAAINAAIQAARVISYNNGLVGLNKVTIDFPTDKVCRVFSSIDMTGFNTPPTGVLATDIYNRAFLTPYVHFQNARIQCFATDAVCIDAIGAGYVVWENVQVVGNAASIPKIGIQVGRITTATAAGHKFINTVVNGSFWLAAYYNLASEVNNLINPNIENTYNPFAVVGNCVTTSGWPVCAKPGYAVILDGVNHWSATSAFRTITNPPPAGTVDTTIGMLDHNFGPGKIGAQGPATVWIGGAQQIRWQTYVYTSNASTDDSCSVVLYTPFNPVNPISSQVPTNTASFRTHFETIIIDYNFCFDGPGPNPVIDGFTFIEEPGTQANNSVLKILPTSAILGGGGSITMRGVNINYVKAGNPPVAAQTLIQATQLSKFILSGSITLGTAAEWAMPASFSGTLCLAGICDIYLASSTVGLLPTCTAALNGVQRSVTDQTAGGIAYNAAPVGGGLTKRTVICDSTIPGWRQN